MQWCAGTPVRRPVKALQVRRLLLLPEEGLSQSVESKPVPNWDQLHAKRSG